MSVMFPTKLLKNLSDWVTGLSINIPKVRDTGTLVLLKNATLPAGSVETPGILETAIIELTTDVFTIEVRMNASLTQRAVLARYYDAFDTQIGDDVVIAPTSGLTYNIYPDIVAATRRVKIVFVNTGTMRTLSCSIRQDKTADLFKPLNAWLSGTASITPSGLRLPNIKSITASGSAINTNIQSGDSLTTDIMLSESAAVDIFWAQSTNTGKRTVTVQCYNSSNTAIGDPIILANNEQIGISGVWRSVELKSLRFSVTFTNNHASQIGLSHLSMSLPATPKKHFKLLDMVFSLAPGGALTEEVKVLLNGVYAFCYYSVCSSTSHDVGWTLSAKNQAGGVPAVFEGVSTATNYLASMGVLVKSDIVLMGTVDNENSAANTSGWNECVSDSVVLGLKNDSTGYHATYSAAGAYTMTQIGETSQYVITGSATLGAHINYSGRIQLFPGSLTPDGKRRCFSVFEGAAGGRAKIVAFTPNASSPAEATLTIDMSDTLNFEPVAFTAEDLASSKVYRVQQFRVMAYGVK